jgi:hypothetical protein
MAIEAVKPLLPYLAYTSGIIGVLLKSHEALKWYRRQKNRASKKDVEKQLYMKLGIVREITSDYRYRLKTTRRLTKDMERMHRLWGEIANDVERLTEKSFLEIIKDPPANIPELPPDIDEVHLARAVARDTMVHVGNLALRLQRTISLPGVSP